MATLKSAQYTKATASPVDPVPSSDWGSKVRRSFAKFTGAIANGDVVKMIRLPAGKIRVYPEESWVTMPIGTATADLHVGNAAYTKADGSAGAADAISLADNLDVGGAAIGQTLPLPLAAAGRVLEFDSRFGVDIEFLVDTAAGPAAGDSYLSLAYQQGN